MDRKEFMRYAAAGVVSSAWNDRQAGATMVTSSVPAAEHLDAAAYRATRRVASTPYGDIAYIERGKGLAALFLHAFPLNGFQWRGAIARLSTYQRCIAPDLMGLGYSDIPESQDLAPQSQAAMLATLLDTLSVTTVDLVANDSGGGVAHLFAARYPDRVRSILLTNCDTVGDCPPRSFLSLVRLAKAGLYADRAFPPALADPALARSAGGIGGIGYSDPTHPTDEAIDYYFAPLVSSPKRKAQVNRLAVALGENFLDGVDVALRRCTAPVRVVWGASDTVFSKAGPEQLGRTFPVWRGVRRVDQAKLFFPEEMPDLIAEEVARLWGVGESP